MINFTNILSIQNLNIREKNKKREITSNLNMFFDDLRNSLFPYKNDKFSIEMNLKDSILESRVIKFLSLPNYNTYNLTDTLSCFFEDIIYSLLKYKKIVFEIIECENKREKTNYKRMIFIIEGKVKIGKNNVIQYFTKYESLNNNIPRKIKIPIEKCLIIEYPNIYKNYKMIKKIINKIAEMDKYNELQFSSDYINSDKKKQSYYDLSLHHDLMNIEKWKSTKEIGWNFRANLGGYNDMTFEFYRAYRGLIFKKFIINLRYYLFQNIEDIINKVFPQEKHIELVINGLFDIKQINDSINKWFNGEMNFDEVYDIINNK
ncbi:hypothetical protein KAZ01_03555 [Candidatus Gracilibacteria bacterium]|nr:hypothetical protein [Candidatus Gracilibacteria bacterium]